MLNQQVISYHYFHNYAVENLHWLALGFGGLCACLYILVRLRQRLALRREHQEKERTFREIIETALQKRCHVFITRLCTGAKCRAEHRAQFSAVSGFHVQLALSGNHGIHSDWKNQAVSLFFYVVKSGGGATYYTMEGMAESVKRGQLEGYLSVRTTGTLAQTQRRQFVRFAPPSSLIESLEVRFAKKPEPAQPASAMQPRWKTLPQGSVMLRDISANGVRIVVNRTFPEYKDIEVEDRLLMTFNLVDLSTSTTLSWTLVGACCDTFEESSSSCSLGIMFLIEAKKFKKENIISWKEINPQHGVNSLAKWVTQSQVVVQKTLKF